ncbi:MAG TPA: hypothetical protein VIV06_07895 [Candidatus Limnocylindrales bacterium]
MSDRQASIIAADAVGAWPAAPDVRATYQRLLIGGLTPGEAGNLTARLAGLRLCSSGWTLQQIEHLVFLRSVVDSGRLLR